MLASYHTIMKVHESVLENEIHLVSWHQLSRLQEIKMDCEKLINEVRNRKLLWDATTASYKDKKKVKDAWDEVGKALDFDGDSAKKKWRSLRNNYIQERNKMHKQLKSGSAASHIYASKWRFFADMDFLRGVTTPAKLSGNLDSSLCEEVRIVEPGDNNAEKDFQGENDNNLSLNMETNTDENTEKSSEMAPPEKHASNKKKVSHEFEFIQLEREKLNILKKKEERKNDGDYHFLMSFLPQMHQMSQYKNARFRLKMSQLLMETLEDDDPSSHEEAGNTSLHTPTPPVNWGTSNEEFSNDNSYVFPLEKY